MPPSLAKNWGMPNKDRSFHESPEKAGGEGWLYLPNQPSCVASSWRSSPDLSLSACPTVLTLKYETTGIFAISSSGTVRRLSAKSLLGTDRPKCSSPQGCHLCSAMLGWDRQIPAGDSDALDCLVATDLLGTIHSRWYGLP